MTEMSYLDELTLQCLSKNAKNVWLSQFLVFCKWLTSDFWSTVSHTTASTSSGSSDTGMSPSSASPTQNTVAVECRWCHARAPPRPPPPLPSQHPAASTETRILTSQSKQPIALDCPPPPRLFWSLSGHSHLLHFVNWSCLLSLAVATTLGTRERTGLYVRVECNLWNQSLRFIHPEWIRRHFSLHSLQTLNRDLLLLLLRSRDCSSINCTFLYQSMVRKWSQIPR